MLVTEVHSKCQTKNITFGGVFFMSKYSNEFKLKVVEYFINEHYGYQNAKIMLKKENKIVII